MERIINIACGEAELFADVIAWRSELFLRSEKLDTAGKTWSFLSDVPGSVTIDRAKSGLLRVAADIHHFISGLEKVPCVVGERGCGGRSWCSRIAGD